MAKEFNNQSIRIKNLGGVTKLICNPVPQISGSTNRTHKASIYSSPHQLIKTNKAAVGFEPTHNGFANRRLIPLGYAAEI